MKDDIVHDGKMDMKMGRDRKRLLLVCPGSRPDPFISSKKLFSSPSGPPIQ